MKFMIFLCLVAMVAAMAFARPDDKYDMKYDNIDLDEILESKRLLESYVKCLCDEGPCTNEGKELKSHMKEGLENGCAKCTEKQLAGVKKVIRFLINNKPEVWQKLCAKYDPDNKYTKKYEAELKEVKH